ncbi:hypothetical protein ACFLQW_04480 [Candidatus Zixiibacteriota bacterium]
MKSSWWHRIWPAFLFWGLFCSVAVFAGVIVIGAWATDQTPDKYAEDKLIFIGEHDDQPVFLVLTFSRGIAKRDSQIYAAECTGHLFRRGSWTHIGSGGYAAPETTLAAIPSGSGFVVRQSIHPPVFLADFAGHRLPFRITVDSLAYLHGDTVDTDYRISYRRGAGTLTRQADTITGMFFSREMDFTGYNRLAGNTSGYFPGKYEQAVLAAADGSVFILSTDPVAARDPENRVNANFAVGYLTTGDTAIIFDHLETHWPVVNDTLHSGKPLPLRWVTAVESGKWRAEYDDIGHFFYFTGFGIFGVEGTMRVDDTTYQVLGVVEHIHARDKPQ